MVTRAQFAAAHVLAYVEAEEGEDATALHVVVSGVVPIPPTAAVGRATANKVRRASASATTRRAGLGPRIPAMSLTAGWRRVGGGAGTSVITRVSRRGGCFRLLARLSDESVAGSQSCCTQASLNVFNASLNMRLELLRPAILRIDISTGGGS